MTAVTTAMTVGAGARGDSAPAAPPSTPGTPGVPQAPTQVFSENFENNVGVAPVRLTDYVGSSGETYTADPNWLTACNGVIVAADSTAGADSAAGCLPSGHGYDALRQLSYGQGLYEKASDPTSVHTVAALTDNPGPGANKVQFQTVQPIPLVASNRFISFSIDVAAFCTSNDPSLGFYLLNGGTRVQLFTNPIDPCTNPRGVPISVPAIGARPAATLRVGTYPTDGSALFTGSAVGIQLVNGQGAGGGNDSAFTNVRILDTTPQLDKSFAPTSLPQGGTSMLTYTITNTTDLAAKDGWSFTDALPSGLTLADSPAPSTTCPSGVIDAPAGASTLDVTGDLSSGMTSCTVTVPVTSAAAATYTNGPANVSVVGLNPPGSASVTFVPAEDLHVSKAAAPAPYVPGQTLTYTVVVTNSGPSDADGATVSDPLPAELAGAGFTWTCAASAGSTCTASGAGDIDDTVDVAVGGTLTYTVTGTVPAGVQSSLTNTATLTPPAGTSDTACDPDCSASTTTNANPTLGLSVTKTSTPDPYVPGAPLTYTVTVANSGPSDAIGVGVSDPLPPALAGAGFTWTCAPTTGSSCTASGAGDIVDTVDVAAGGDVVYTIAGTVPSSTTGELINGAVATPPAGATAPGCTPSCLGSNSSPPGPVVALSITKSASPSPYVPGDTLTYTVTVANAGPSDAIGATVEDPLPAGLAGAGFTWTCASTTGSTCGASGSGDIDDTVDVAAGGTLTYTIAGTVPASTQTPLDNTATVFPPAANTDAGCTPSCSAPITTAAQPTVGLTVTKTALPSPYVPGAALTYTVTVANAGPSDAVGATIEDPLPSALAGAGFTWTCVPSGSDSTCTDNGAGDIVDTVNIAAGGNVTYTVSGTVPPSLTGSLANSATATPPTGASDAGCSPNCSSAITTDADPTVDLSVTKTSTPNPYVPGEGLTYTVTVTNSGPSDAIGATVDDPLSAELASFSWTCTASALSTCTASGTGSIHDTVDVTSGGQLVYTVSGTVPASSTAVLTNTATVTPPTGSADAGCSPDCDATDTNPAAPAVALAATKTVSADPYTPGKPLTYTLTVTNAGPSDAAGVTVSDPFSELLPGMDFTWTCTPGKTSNCTPSGSGDLNDTAQIAADGQVVYTIHTTVPPGTQNELTNVATVTAPSGVLDPDCTPECLATAVSTAHPAVSLAVTKTAKPQPFVPGAALTYTVTVTNAGPSAALGATVSDPLPAALSAGHFTWTCRASTGSSCTASGSANIDDTVDVAAGGQVVYTVSGTAPFTTSPITNTATVTPPPGATDPGCSPTCSATNTDTAATTTTTTTSKAPAATSSIPLAVTGLQLWQLAALAMALLVAGTALSVSRRRQYDARRGRYRHAKSRRRARAHAPVRS